MIKDKILIIDDETGIRSSLRGILEDEGYIVKTAESGEQGLDLLRGENFDVLLLDVWLPEMSGLDVLEKTKATEDNLQVIMITGHGSIETAVRATKLGAFDFLEKPLSLDKVVLTVKNALRQRRLEEENILLKQRVSDKHRLIGESPSVRALKSQIKAVSPTGSRILILGENGTGKKLVARLIHQNSPRKKFVQVSVGAVPEDILESQLFGGGQGAAAEADRQKKGKLLLADGGTLFLDEISQLSRNIQDKLVRFIDDGSFEPLGTSETLESKARLIASTNMDLKGLVKEGTFSEDLFYKISVIPMHIPPLRERTEDIPLLIEHYLKVFSHEYGCKTKHMNRMALEAFQNYSWPGNISELINVIERFVIMIPEQEIQEEHLSLLVEPRESQYLPGQNGPVPFEEAKSRFEKEYIHKSLIRNQWDLSKTAVELNLEDAQLMDKIERLGIDFLG